jgi:catechol 2,3-dioxygenase-like lactoylglutathione lyase family enzyme
MVLKYFGIRVTNMERSLKFYVGLLGLRERGRGTMHHGGQWVLLEDRRTKQRLELNWYPRDSPYATKYNPGDGLDHIGFKVKSPKATYKDLLSKGVKSALAPDDKDGVRGIYYVKDPDGNWIEFFG